MANADALLAHILSQTKSNIEFLISQDQISPADGREIIAKLPSADGPAVLALSQHTQRLALAPPEPNPVVPARRGVPPPPRRMVQVKALWDWNIDGQVRHNRIDSAS